MSDVPATDPADLAESLASGERVGVLDVRDRDEYEAWRIDGPGVESAQVPHVRFLEASVSGDPGDLVADLPEPLVVVCGRGEASAEVAGLLREAGVDAANLAGGMEAWARVYRARPVVEEGGTTDGGTTDDVTVLQYDRPASGCLAYLVVAGAEAAVIDPLRAFADRYAADAEDRDANLAAALDTHVHADHVSGVRGVAEATGARTVLPEGARDRGLAFDAELVADGETVAVGDASLEAIHVPGHTSEMTAFRLSTAGRDLLFAGDLAFQRSVARPDLEAGDEGARDLARGLHRSLTETLFALADETLVLPAHRDPASTPEEEGPEGAVFGATVGTLRERLTMEDDPEAFAERVASDLPPRPANYEAIVATNLGQEAMDDDRAFEAELGPNNCAVDAD
ncbi:MBL fold metallo-hydrolase [Haloparvum sedimenti]|uniref:MBL fold metallo-hydrolase n=1 Tax=Haloparvum sedimenti TaxID=1678448 RepID=UPI00071E9479|nr:MBL fold metallo-hydrolase [Haloparvum sedimenti]